MDVRLVMSIREELKARTTEELLGLYRANDQETWSPDAFLAMREILIERGGLDPHSPLPPSAKPYEPGFAYSRPAEFCLGIGTLIASVGCVAATIASVGAIYSGAYLMGLVVGPLSFLFQLAMAIVFLRVRDLRPRT
jgi:hypothetical protein